MSIYLACFVLAVGIMGCAFCISLRTCTNRIADSFWGLGLMLITWYALVATGHYLPRHLLVTTLITLWGIRLSGYVTYRHWGKGEDPRYSALLEEWGGSFYLQSFFKLFMFQALLLFLVSLSVITIMTNVTAGSFNWSDFIAVLLWCTGFACEVIGDWQLQRFLIDPLHKDQIMDQGLWRISRHPNYFGEIVMWWSIWMLALPAGYVFITLISPVTLTAFIIFLSLPLTEKQFIKNAAYTLYQKRTSALLPWPRKKLTDA